MQWDPETADWELWLPFISLWAGTAWPWVPSIPGPGQEGSKAVTETKLQVPGELGTPTAGQGP